MASRKYSIILGNLGNTCDRFLSSGYKDQPSREEQFKTAASIPDVEGIELVGSWDITTEEDGKKALAESIETVKALEKVIDNFGDEKISQLVSLGDATAITAAVRGMLFP